MLFPERSWWEIFNAHLLRFLAPVQDRLSRAMPLSFIQTNFEGYPSFSTVWEGTFLFLEDSELGEKGGKQTEEWLQAIGSARLSRGSRAACWEPRPRRLRKEREALTCCDSEEAGRGGIFDCEWGKRVSARDREVMSVKESSEWGWERPLWVWGLVWGRRCEGGRERGRKWREETIALERKQ